MLVAACRSLSPLPLAHTTPAGQDTVPARMFASGCQNLRGGGKKSAPVTDANGRGPSRENAPPRAVSPCQLRKSGLEPIFRRHHPLARHARGDGGKREG